MLRRNADALLPARLKPAPPAHSTGHGQPGLPVLLGQLSEFALPLVCESQVGVVVDQAHFSLLVVPDLYRGSKAGRRTWCILRIFLTPVGLRYLRCLRRPTSC